MIGSWMLYAVVVSALFTVAAHALERVVVARGRPRRMLWVVATTLSVGLPVVTGLRRLSADETLPVTVVPFTITVPAPESIVPVAQTPQRGEQIDRALLMVWAALSALLLIRLGAGIATLRKARRGWRREELDGMTVCVSPNVGPAVVGLRSMNVVLPEWILGLDVPLRALVLRHEQEHRSARDPYLLFGAAAAVCLMPWNPALWFQARRLRLAIELDCDARVLRAHPTPERYGLLMLTIAQRRSVAPTLFAPMLAEPATQLERRILEMRTTTRRIARWTVVGGTVLAAGAVTLAGSLRSAGATTMRAVRTMGSEIAANALPTRSNAYQQGNPTPRYPDLLRSAGIEGSVVVDVSTDENGRPEMSSMRIVGTTHDLLTASVRDALTKWRLSPRANVRLPFLFVMSNKSARDMASVPAGTVVIVGVPASNPGVHVTSAVVVDGAAPATAMPREAPVRRDSVIRASIVPDSVIVIDGVRQARAARAATPGIRTADTVATYYSKRTATERPVAQGAADPTYFEFQVEKPGSPRPGNVAPRYPDELRDARIEGEVLVQFVLDTLGRPDMDTFKVLRSTHDLFTNTVKSSLPNMLFYPAEVGGRKVKQLIQMPFNFNLTKDPN
ncbi:MAG TPA: M56 family metallopeptidase [Gemmatimonadaceae bacterium]